MYRPMGRRCPGWETWTGRAALRCSSCVVIGRHSMERGRSIRTATGAAVPSLVVLPGNVEAPYSSFFWYLDSLVSVYATVYLLCLLCRVYYLPNTPYFVFFFFSSCIRSHTLFIFTTKLFTAAFCCRSVLCYAPILISSLHLIRLKSWISSGVRSLQKALLGIFLLVILV